MSVHVAQGSEHYADFDKIYYRYVRPSRDGNMAIFVHKGDEKEFPFKWGAPPEKLSNQEQ